MKPTSDGVGFGAEFCTGIANRSTAERRLKAIGGQAATACGPVLYSDKAITVTTNKCVKHAFAHRKGFYAWYELGGGVVYETVVGIAGDGKGNVFVLSFDDAGASRAGLGEDVEVLDNGDTVLVRCPKPIRFREGYSRNLTCITQAGNLRLSPH